MADETTPPEPTPIAETPTAETPTPFSPPVLSPTSPLDETVPGGAYVVGGVLVDSEGQPVKKGRRS